ncbi:hypothetical protein Oweho_1664 [Owenweeksia hongkongensis DSM 17368]|uniref:Uncharacterized protein n=1 Tax=Owenweeksia hongkongensis (strain DSM 17368 / CIP 108786 / JCM 12287 / NRRL B-23963 / UST20020801) TaxID=926562 RepID=G8R012_OWEHD|nr:hypothetical protein [Owenweeksia hongkongensis]AEV32652.1 hypothetical protein Oweho_1664 [Owenweeksia hongkongensis DSM 17368]
MTRVKQIGLLLLALFVTYGFAAFFIPKYLSRSYIESFNSKRKELHLLEIGNAWKLDSIVLEEIGNYSIEDRKNISEFQLSLEDERLYCQYWSPVTSEDVHANFVGKRIYYWESFWLWKNKRLFEQDTYEKKGLDNIYKELIIGFNFKNDSSYAHQFKFITAGFRDSVNTYAENNNLEICGNGLVVLEGSEFISVSDALSILKDW